jgi:hypothetical protein
LCVTLGHLDPDPHMMVIQCLPEFHMHCNEKDSSDNQVDTSLVFYNSGTTLHALVATSYLLLVGRCALLLCVQKKRVKYHQRICNI